MLRWSRTDLSSPAETSANSESSEQRAYLQPPAVRDGLQQPLTMFRSKRIEQCVKVSHRSQHICDVHQCCYEKSRHFLRRGIVLGQCFLDMREDQLTAQLARCQVGDAPPPESEQLSFQRRVYQSILSGKG